MAIDDRQLDEKHSLGQFCNVLRETRGIDRCYHTIRLWALDGVRSRRSEGFIRLRSEMNGGTRETSLRWYQEFQDTIEDDRSEL